MGKVEDGEAKWGREEGEVSVGGVKSISEGNGGIESA